MKVAVFGATGGTGRLLIPRLLAAGHDVTAVARVPEAVTLKHERLRVIKGDVRSAADVDAAVAGQDAVFNVFGPRSLGKDNVQETFMRNAVDAMQKHSTKRFVNLSAWGAGTTAPYIVFMNKLLRNSLLRHLYDDKDRGEVILQSSQVNFVSVYPGRLLNSTARGGVKASVDGRGLTPRITRDDLSAFLVDCLTDDTWVRKPVIIGW